MIYSSFRLGEIADDITSIDNALKWGFAWSLGPFEIWDSLGFLKTLKRMESEGMTVPRWITEMSDKGFHHFIKL